MLQGWRRTAKAAAANERADGSNEGSHTVVLPPGFAGLSQRFLCGVGAAPEEITEKRRCICKKSVLGALHTYIGHTAKV